LPCQRSCPAPRFRCCPFLVRGTSAMHACHGCSTRSFRDKPLVVFRETRSPTFQRRGFQHSAVRSHCHRQVDTIPMCLSINASDLSEHVASSDISSLPSTCLLKRSFWSLGYSSASAAGSEMEYQDMGNVDHLPACLCAAEDAERFWLFAIHYRWSPR